MIKNVLRRFMSLLLSTLMVAALLPAASTTAYAAAISGLTDTTIGLDGDSDYWTANGTQINGSVAGSAATTCSSASSGNDTLTITNNKADYAVLSFSYEVTANDNSGTIQIDGEAIANSSKGATGNYSKELEKGDSVTIYLASATGAYTTSIKLTDLNLVIVASATTTFEVAENGSYTVDGTKITAQMSETRQSTVAYALVATPASGYQFFGWYSETENAYLSSNATYSLYSDVDRTIRPVFISSSLAVFGVGSARFYDLNEANDYAKNNGGIIVLISENAALPSGEYTISDGNTLLIPFDADYNCYTTAPEFVTSYSTPSLFRMLTMSSGAHITVESGATISVSAQLNAASGGANAKATTSGKYGRIHMNEGSSITVNGLLSCYGYITGSGTITANSGADVHEVFEVRESRGGGGFYAMNGNDKKVFLVSQYYIQNVEVPMTINSGASLVGHGALYASSMIGEMNVEIIGQTSGLFHLSSGFITKTYLPAQDRCQFDVNGIVDISNVSLEVLSYKFDSASYILPINGHMNINLLGETTANITNDVEFLPGVRMTIGADAELAVASGKSVYVYDSEKWGKYVYSSKRIAASAYSPTRTYTRGDNNTDLADVLIDVNGKITVNGYLYTTTDGANITSSNGTGVIDFNSAAGTKTVIYQATTQSGSNFSTSVNYDEVPIVPAKLHNGVNSSRYADSEQEYTLTSGVTGAAEDYYTYCMTCDMWVKGDSGLAHIIQDGEVVGHADDLAEAKSDYATPAAGRYIQMLANSDGETVTFVNGTVIDLNGNAITGSGVSVDGTLYGMDSTSDGYGTPSGSISVSDGTVATVTEFKGKNNVNNDTATLHRYLAVQSGSAWQFHRFNISVTDYYLEVLSTGSASIGFGATFRGDSTVIAAVTDMGFTVNGTGAWAGKDNISLADQYKLYYTVDANTGDNTAFAMLKFDENTTQNSEEQTVNFLSALKTYYDSTSNTQVKNVIDKFRTAAQLTWPST